MLFKNKKYITKLQDKIKEFELKCPVKNKKASICESCGKCDVARGVKIALSIYKGE